MIKSISNLPKKILVKLISFYQVLLSPDHSWLRAKYPYGFCRHYPSCSEYSKQSLDKYGIFKGGWLALKRVVRCNPFVQPSIDLVPNSKF